MIDGSFYVNDTDLSLPGPLPIQLKRNYISLNQTPLTGSQKSSLRLAEAQLKESESIPLTEYFPFRARTQTGLAER